MSFDSDFLPLKPSPSLHHLSPDDKIRYLAIVNEMRQVQIDFFARVRNLPAIENYRPKFANIAKRFWVIEWSLARRGILRTSVNVMRGISIDTVGNLRLLLSHLSDNTSNRPRLQISGGPTLATVRFFILNGDSQPEAITKHIAEVLLILQQMLSELNGLIKSMKQKRKRMLTETRVPNMTIDSLANHPTEEVIPINKVHLQYTQIHAMISHIRLCITFLQQPEEKEKFLSIQTMPAWGKAVSIWQSNGWNKNCQTTMQNMLDQPCQVNPFPTNPFMSICKWNVRGVANSNFIHAANNFLDEVKPAVAILTETRIQKSLANSILKDLHLDKWETTETMGFKGGIWLGWNSRLAQLQILSKSSDQIEAIIHVLNCKQMSP